MEYNDNENKFKLLNKVRKLMQSSKISSEKIYKF
jgi:hypothetical protein